ncbi:MAG TPA: hypothetical protein VMV55_01440 [Methanoregula sp.]|nr:hypothetical protein [Methanoregula sp.]
MNIKIPFSQDMAVAAIDGYKLLRAKDELIKQFPDIDAEARR